MTPARSLRRSGRFGNRLLYAAGRTVRAPSSIPLRITIAALCALLVACADAPDGAGPSASEQGRGLYVRANWQSARGTPGHRVHVVDEKIACSECHDLSGKEVNRPSSEPCAACHEQEARIEHAKQEGAASTDCMMCHSFVVDGELPELERKRAENPADCLRCHESQQGTKSAVVVHAGSDCLTCHKPHEKPQVEPSDCARCHSNVRTAHAATDKAPAAVCTTCHQDQHALASKARGTCKECHAANEPVIPATALFADGHAECTGCHRPHEYAKEDAVPCAECHTGVRVLGQGRIAAHNECTSCHRPHAVRERISSACVGCHEDTHTDHPRVRPGAVCTSCHDAHPATPKAARARACSSCHHGAADDHAFHGGKSTACTDCHTPHRFGLKTEDGALCARCHGAEHTATRAIAQHQRCADCHRGLPHRPEALLEPCASCHGSVAHTAIQPHSPCTGCHEPHGGSVQKACSECHAEPHRTAPAGHRDCRSCHDPHSGKRAAAKTCASCHSAQNAGPHATAVRGGCESCHRAHGPGGVASPPACNTCHRSPLPGLHAEAKHSDCGKCHRAHGTSLAFEREACLGCHTAQRRDHHPEAPRCSGCHLFTKP